MVTAGPTGTPLEDVIGSTLPGVDHTAGGTPVTPPTTTTLMFGGAVTARLTLTVSPDLEARPPLGPGRPVRGVEIPDTTGNELTPKVTHVSPLKPCLPLQTPGDGAPTDTTTTPTGYAVPRPTGSRGPGSPGLGEPGASLPPRIRLPSAK